MKFTSQGPAKGWQAQDRSARCIALSQCLGQPRDVSPLVGRAAKILQPHCDLLPSNNGHCCGSNSRLHLCSNQCCQPAHSRRPQPSHVGFFWCMTSDRQADLQEIAMLGGLPKHQGTPGAEQVLAALLEPAQAVEYVVPQGEGPRRWHSCGHPPQTAALFRPGQLGFYFFLFTNFSMHRACTGLDLAASGSCPAARGCLTSSLAEVAP